MRAEFLRELVLDRRRGLDEAGLVDVLDDLDADLLQLARPSRFSSFSAIAGSRLRDFVGRGLHPLLLLGRQAVPGLVADPDAVVVGLVLGHRQDRRHFVVLVREVDVDAVLGDVDDAGLQRGVDLAERHVHGLRAIGREMRVLGLGRLHADLLALDVVDRLDLLLAVHVAHAHRQQAEHLRALHRILDHRAEQQDQPSQVVVVARRIADIPPEQSWSGTGTAGN